MILPKDSPEIVESGDHSSRENALPLPIETGVLGIVDAQKVDWFRIEAKKGERLLIQVWAERLDSKLDGMLAVSDAEGRELETSRGHFSRDPLIDFTAPADGTYFVSLTDILYRGGSGSFYRLLVSRKPVVDFVVPPPVNRARKRNSPSTAAISPEGAPARASNSTGNRSTPSKSKSSCPPKPAKSPPSPAPPRARSNCRPSNTVSATRTPSASASPPPPS